MGKFINSEISGLKDWDGKFNAPSWRFPRVEELAW
jgi:hypothetical protein